MRKARMPFRRAPKRAARAWLWGGVAAGLLTGLGLALWWWRRGAATAATEEAERGGDAGGAPALEARRGAAHSF